MILGNKEVLLDCQCMLCSIRETITKDFFFSLNSKAKLFGEEKDKVVLENTNISYS